MSVPSCVPHCPNEPRLKNLEAQLAAFKREMADMKKEMTELKERLLDPGTAINHQTPPQPPALQPQAVFVAAPAPKPIAPVLVPPPLPSSEMLALAAARTAATAFTVDAGSGSSKQAKKATIGPKGTDSDSANAAQHMQFPVLPSSSTLSSVSFGAGADLLSAPTQHPKELQRVPVGTLEPVDEDMKPVEAATKRSRKREQTCVAVEAE